MRDLVDGGPASSRALAGRCRGLVPRPRTEGSGGRVACFLPAPDKNTANPLRPVDLDAHFPEFLRRPSHVWLTGVSGEERRSFEELVSAPRDGETSSSVLRSSRANRAAGYMSLDLGVVFDHEGRPALSPRISSSNRVACTAGGPSVMSGCGATRAYRGQRVRVVRLSRRRAGGPSLGPRLA